MINTGSFSSSLPYQMDTVRKPLFGKTRQLIDRIHSLDDKWYVEFWMVRFYFMGFEVYSSKKEVVKHVNNRAKYKKQAN